MTAAGRTLVGMVFAVFGLSNFISMIGGGWVGNAWGMKNAVLIGGVISATTFVIMGIQGLPLAAFIVALVFLALAQGFGVPQFTTFAATVLPESRATMTSLNSSFLYLGLTIGSALGGWLYQSLSFLAIGISAAIATLLAVAVTTKIMQ